MLPRESGPVPPNVGYDRQRIHDVTERRRPHDEHIVRCSRRARHGVRALGNARRRSVDGAGACGKPRKIARIRTNGEDDDVAALRRAAHR